MLVKDLPSKWPIRKLNYIVDYESPHDESSLMTFGHFNDDSNKPLTEFGFSEHYKGIFNVAEESDKYTCIVSSICILENGMYVVTDNKNRKLKRFKKNYEFYDCIALDWAPTSACLSGSDEIAVALSGRRIIQFVLCTRTLSFGNSFSTEKCCYGVFFDSESGHLFVCCGISVSIYTKNGTLMKTIEKDETGKQLFADAKNCVITSGQDIIYVTDLQNGLIALNKNAGKSWNLNNTKLQEARGACAISSEHLLVASSTLHNILLVDKDGSIINKISKRETGMSILYTLGYDRKRSTIMLGGNSDDIYIFFCCRK